MFAKINIYSVIQSNVCIYVLVTSVKIAIGIYLILPVYVPLMRVYFK